MARPWIRVLLAAQAALAIAGCCSRSGDMQKSFTIDPAEPEYAGLMASCEASDNDCTRLCMTLLGPPPIDSTREIVDCFLNHRDDGLVTVQTRYYNVDKCDFGGGGGGSDPWFPQPEPGIDGGWPLPDAMPGDVDAQEVVDATPPDAEVTP